MAASACGCQKAGLSPELQRCTSVHGAVGDDDRRCPFALVSHVCGRLVPACANANGLKPRDDRSWGPHPFVTGLDDRLRHQCRHVSAATVRS